MRRIRTISAGCILALVAVACGHTKPPTTQRVIASSTPFLPSIPTPSTTARAKATTVPIATASRGVVNPPKTPAPNLATANIKLTKLGTFKQPVAMATRANDTALYIVQKTGQVLAWRAGHVLRTVLDISSELYTPTGTEQGLLGLAFSPNGNKMYVYFTGQGSPTGTDCGLSASDTCSGYDTLREYSVADGKAVTSSARNLLKFADPYPNHNGGNLAFGPDGYLYLGIGDGGSAGDPQNRAQNLDSPFGKLYRIDPTPSGSAPYSVPPSNPFATSSGTKALVWAYGLRNPWRWSFDRSTKDLWIGDVGQDTWEEIDFQPADDKGGDNYGWNQMEGNHPYNGGSPPANYHRPIYEYNHSDGNCSVTGGYVYRGTKIHDLEGAYVFGDYCAGQLRAFTFRNSAAVGARFLGVSVDQLSSFGQDTAGNLYAFSLTGAFYRIDAA